MAINANDNARAADQKWPDGKNYLYLRAAGEPKVTWQPKQKDDNQE